MASWNDSAAESRPFNRGRLSACRERACPPHEAGERWTDDVCFSHVIGTRILIDGVDVLACLPNRSRVPMAHGHIEPHVLDYELRTAACDPFDPAAIAACGDCGLLSCNPVLCGIAMGRDTVYRFVAEREDYWLHGQERSRRMLCREFLRAHYEQQMFALHEPADAHRPIRDPYYLPRDYD